MTKYQYIYLHGFASSPLSNKAQYLNNCFQKIGINLNIIDLNQGDFTKLTLTRQIKQAASHFNLDNDTKIRIIGSSFGGLTGTWLAQKYTQIESMILLAPAFGFKNHWLPKLGQETINQWKQNSYLPVYHYGEKKEMPLHYQFLKDLNKYEDSQLNKSLPTLILHGKFDEVIPINSSYQYVKNNPLAKIIALESDHSLANVMPEIWLNIRQFLQI
jgi:predicted esterase YcpF (UPF0227 family)